MPHSQSPMLMLQNYLKIAFRVLWKHKLFSFINIVGLASGMTICLIAILQIKSAFDYDRFHPHSERTYRLITDVQPTLNHNEVMPLASAPLPVGDFLQRNYPFIERVAQVFYGIPGEATANERTLPITGAFVNPAFFGVFGFSLVYGQPAKLPRTVVLTATTAERFFGRRNPLGQSIQLKDMGFFTITGVLAPSEKSHLQFDMLVSMASVPLLEQSRQLKAQTTNWTNPWAAYTYIQLKPDVPQERLAAILPSLAVQGARLGGPAATYSFRLQPLTQISPGREPLYNLTHEPIARNLVSLAALGLAVLLLAGFNYVNLTLARSLSRSREVGVRKVIGAQRLQLIGQFIIESVVLVVFAAGLAVGLWQLISRLVVVQRLVGTVQWDTELVLWCLVFSLLTGLLAGGVPARLLSGLHPVQTLKNQSVKGIFKGMSWRKALTVMQFTVSLTAMIFMAVMYQQSRYMTTTEYGFNRANILNIPIVSRQYGPLSTELSHLAGVEQVAASSEALGNRAATIRLKRPQSVDSLQVATLSVDANFAPMMGLTFIAGRNLPVTSQDSASQYTLLNESTVQALRLGSPQQIIGQTLLLGDSTLVTVVGVVKDFHFMSLIYPIKPLVLRSDPRAFRVMQIKVAPIATESLIPAIAKAWARLNPYEPFQYVWFDKALHEQYANRDDQLFIGLLTGMALTIACLGMLGMVTYTTETRKKEVGIRKVMGSTVGQIVGLLSGSFIRLLLIAGLMALPAGYLLGTAFLQQYAYHIRIGTGTLVLCLLALLVIGGFTVGWQTYRAALMNPVKSLRSE